MSFIDMSAYSRVAFKCVLRLLRLAWRMKVRAFRVSPHLSGQDIWEGKDDYSLARRQGREKALILAILAKKK
mgnify:FL=1|jgi:hypothetical protein